jgi:predicted alpha/beta superfamily hydrolase
VKSRLVTAALLALSFSCLTAQVSAAQSAVYQPVTVPRSELRPMKSSSTGRSYDLYIHKPADFDKSKDKKYPVLYLLDGQWDFKLLDSVIGGLVYDKWMPDIVVVGITYSGDNPDYEALRAMDYTPSPGDRKGSGDGPKFLKFIKSELIPYIEANYRGEPSRRILGGHSFGGLFTLYAMFTDPSLFWGYLAGSPDLQWDNGFLMKQEADFASKHKELPVRLFLAVGGAEELLTPDINFVRTFAARNYDGLHWDGRVVEGEGHAGVKPEFYNRGLRFLFSMQ